MARITILTRRETLALGAGGLAALTESRDAFAAERAGSVAELVGNATASIEGKTRSLAIEGAVLLGDLLSTEEDARLALLLGTRTKLRLGGGTELRIDRYIADAGGEIEFAQGTIGFDRKGRPADGNLRFKTPYGLIAVRGTVFYAGPSRGTFGVVVQRGSVAVSAAGKTVLLGPGQGTDIAEPGSQPTQPSFWKTERILELHANLPA